MRLKEESLNLVGRNGYPYPLVRYRYGLLRSMLEQAARV